MFERVLRLERVLQLEADVASAGARQVGIGEGDCTGGAAVGDAGGVHVVGFTVARM